MMRSIISTKKNLLGISKGEAFINTLWLFNSLHFGLRGRGEHRQMCWGDVQLMKDADGTEHLHSSERQTKTRSAADPRNVRPIKPKAFATSDLPRERDPVVVFKIYSEKRPESMNKPDAPLYLGVNHTTKNSDKRWFKANAMGVNKLNSLLKTMAEKSGLDNSHLTNHSAGKRMIQTLNDKDIPPSHILQLSGPKNAQSINNYSHVFLKNNRKLSGSTSMLQTETHSLVEQQKKKVQRRQQQGYSRVLCFTKEISPSISARPRVQQKHKKTNL